MDVKNRIILITGASHGIGFATAQKCVSMGAKVIAGFNQSDHGIQRLISDCGSDNIFPFRADVRNDREVVNLREWIAQSFGYIDGIVNCAGIITRHSNWSSISDEDWMLNINTNLIGVWRVIKTLYTLLSKNGSIVNVSSIYGIWGHSTELPYSISKMGVIMLTTVLAKELSPMIRVNAVCPGNTLTTMIPSSDVVQEIEHDTALRRSAQPEEIANAIVFLLSGESSYITGDVLNVDGGFHLK